MSFDTTFASAAVTGVVQLSDTLWLATVRGVGFARTTTNLSDWRKANDGLPTLTVDRLASDGRSVYALADGDIYRWESDSLKWITIGFIGNVYNLEDDQGTVLASTSSGIWWHRSGSPLFTRVVDSPIAGPGAGLDTDAAVDPALSTRFYAGGGRDTLWE